MNIKKSNITILFLLVLLISHNTFAEDTEEESSVVEEIPVGVGFGVFFGNIAMGYDFGAEDFNTPIPNQLTKDFEIASNFGAFFSLFAGSNWEGRVKFLVTNWEGSEFEDVNINGYKYDVETEINVTVWSIELLYHLHESYKGPYIGAGVATSGGFPFVSYWSVSSSGDEVPDVEYIDQYVEGPGPEIVGGFNLPIFVDVVQFGIEGTWYPKQNNAAVSLVLSTGGKS